MELPTEGEKLKRGRRAGQRRRTPLELARDRSLINHLRLLERRSLTEIAEIVSKQYEAEVADEETGLNKEGKLPPRIKRKQVAFELEKVVEEFKEGRAEEIHGKRLELIRRYEQLAGYAYREYEASKSPKVVKTSEKGSGPEGGFNKKRTVREERAVGDKGFLYLYRECTDRIAELEAAIPPKKTALTNPDGTEPFKFEGVDELKRLAALADTLLAPQSHDKLPEVDHGNKT
jgi:hypothetical protein